MRERGGRARAAQGRLLVRQADALPSASAVRTPLGEEDREGDEGRRAQRAPRVHIFRLGRGEAGAARGRGEERKQLCGRQRRGAGRRALRRGARALRLGGSCLRCVGVREGVRQSVLGGGGVKARAS